MAQNRLIISKQLEKSLNPGSVIVTDTNNEQKYIQPGTSGQVLTSNGAGAEPTWQNTASSSFTITDGTNSQVITSGDTLTITAGNGLTATVSATDLLTLVAKLSTDAGNDITFGSDGGLYLSKDSLLTNVTWNDATNELVLTFDSGSVVNVPIIDSISAWLADFTITGDTGTDLVNNHETVNFTGTGGMRATVTANQVSYQYRTQVDTFLGLTSGTTVTASQTPLTIIGVTRNGLDQIVGATEDYTISGTTVTFNTAFGPSGGGAGVENIKLIYSY